MSTKLKLCIFHMVRSLLHREKDSQTVIGRGGLTAEEYVSTFSAEDVVSFYPEQTQLKR
jgi:hypothetical protein